MQSPPPLSPTPLEFYGGLAGALAPFALFLTGVGWLALSGAPDERGFWPILLAALTVGLAVARDRRRYVETVIEAMSQPIVSLMIMAWLLSGVLGVVLTESGFVQALVWLAREAGVSGGAYIGVAFVVCSLVSTSTGTSFGTILIAGPLLYPAGGALRAAPAVLMGAILAGSTLGDSISPISDTTIASAGSQGADIPGTVRSRLKYVIPAGLAALVASTLLGVYRGQHIEATTGLAVTGSPSALPMLLVPGLVIALLVARRHLLEGLLTGITAGLALGVALGLIAPGRILFIDTAAHSARGLVIDGLMRGVGVSVFTLLLIGLVGALQASASIAGVLRWAKTSTSSPRRAEAWIVGSVSIAVLLTTHSVVAMLTVGAFVRELGERAGISAYRRANLLDMTVCTYPFLLPYFLPTILASSASASGAAFGLPRVGPLDIGMMNTYAWALVVAVAVAVMTGYGRTEGAPDDIRRPP